MPKISMSVPSSWFVGLSGRCHVRSNYFFMNNRELGWMLSYDYIFRLSWDVVSHHHTWSVYLLHQEEICGRKGAHVGGRGPKIGPLWGGRGAHIQYTVIQKHKKQSTMYKTSQGLAKCVNFFCHFFLSLMIEPEVARFVLCARVT